MGPSPIFNSLVLPNGTSVPNRIAKAAMEENLADIDGHAPSKEIFRLYDAWAKGGAGTIITGNVMVDRHAFTGPGGVALDEHSDLALFRKWADISKAQGAQVWMQINHPGRQMRADLGLPVYAPSATPLDMGGLSSLFGQPQEMSGDMVEDVIRKFIKTATLAEEAGFSGVQVHAAHGYLLSQFLSPLVNKRTDRWGGPLGNRAEALYSVVRGIRATVKPTFTVSVKLNSADFQKGGFSHLDAVEVVKTLNTLGVDCVEISGGSYESPAMSGAKPRDSTTAREAYFLEFAKEIVAASTVPIMLTGGISRRAVLEDVLAAGIDIAGMATALALVPDFPAKLQRGESIPPAKVVTPNWPNRAIASLATMGVVKWNMGKHSRGARIRWQIWPVFALILELFLNWKRVRTFTRVRQKTE